MFRASGKFLLTAVILTFFSLAACDNLKFSKAPDDGVITTSIQAKLFEDPVLKTRDIRVSSHQGVVTVSGNVQTELEKAAVERLAGQIEGVKEVVNELALQPETAVKAEEPLMEEPGPKPATRVERTRSAPPPPARPAETAQVVYNPPPAAAVPPAAQTETPRAAEPARAPAREPEVVTIPAGTIITVQMIDEIDSERHRPGQEFAAIVAAPVASGDRVVIPVGSDARVRLVNAEQAGRLAGRSELEVELVGLAAGQNTYFVESSVHEKQGASRGKRTAATVGGGAALGGLIGAVAGKGKGAAIGAAVGAGAGTAVQAATKGEQVRIPSETKLDFTLKSPLSLSL
jgi:hypothetical protein